VADLRIVAGEWRGRRIAVPGAGVRPTADRVREAWMSIVRPALDGAQVADLYAGSGALGLEALSRGAAHCDFVERDAAVRRTLDANVQALGAGTRATVHAAEALAFVDAAVTARAATASTGQGAGGPCWDVAFADPPYAEGTAAALAERWLATGFATIFGVEHEAAVTLPVPADGRVADRRVYGDTALTIYRATT
jgi:16S rRNA (guanine966-N2)-methyltransferase